MDTVKIIEEQKTSAIERTCLLRGVGAIGRERLPLAVALMRGTANASAIKGDVRFYYTPLGTLVCASVSGLEVRRGIYTLQLKSERGSVQKFAIPPLYERSGYAWCSTLTAKLSHDDLTGKILEMYLDSKGERVLVAVGTVR